MLDSQTAISLRHCSILVGKSRDVALTRPPQLPTTYLIMTQGGDADLPTVLSSRTIVSRRGKECEPSILHHRPDRIQQHNAYLQTFVAADPGASAHRTDPHSIAPSGCRGAESLGRHLWPGGLPHARLSGNPERTSTAATVLVELGDDTVAV